MRTAGNSLKNVVIAGVAVLLLAACGGGGGGGDTGTPTTEPTAAPTTLECYQGRTECWQVNHLYGDGSQIQLRYRLNGEETTLEWKKDDSELLVNGTVVTVATGSAASVGNTLLEHGNSSFWTITMPNGHKFLVDFRYQLGYYLLQINYEGDSSMFWTQVLDHRADTNQLKTQMGVPESAGGAGWDNWEYPIEFSSLYDGFRVSSLNGILMFQVKQLEGGTERIGHIYLYTPLAEG